MTTLGLCCLEGLVHAAEDRVMFSKISIDFLVCNIR
uniref:Uncharacterized protein n=1 Tax=Arundo donax TaxID=35708 RepID=A0A0A9AXB7_ARUDO